MSDKKHELLLIAAALVITITALLYSVFDSPKYNSLEASVITTTQKETTVVVPNGKININTADADELSQLEGIGAKKAQAIIDYREKNGAFRTVDELTNISGISTATLEKNIDTITV